MQDISVTSKRTMEITKNLLTSNLSKSQKVNLLSGAEGSHLFSNPN